MKYFNATSINYLFIRIISYYLYHVKYIGIKIDSIKKLHIPLHMLLSLLFFCIISHISHTSLSTCLQVSVLPSMVKIKAIPLLFPNHLCYYIQPQYISSYLLFIICLSTTLTPNPNLIPISNPPPIPFQNMDYIKCPCKSNPHAL